MNPQFQRRCVALPYFRVLDSTPRAVLVRLYDRSKHWLPLSQLRDFRAREGSGPGEVEASPWILNEKQINVPRQRELRDQYAAMDPAEQEDYGLDVAFEE
jgi:hypothetical protein